METITCIIEKHLKNLLEQADNGVLDIRRSALAKEFGCAPSQINYVLETRFNLRQGYLVESRRGSGGFVRIFRVQTRWPDLALELVNSDNGAMLTQSQAEQLIDQLLCSGAITARESRMLRAAVDKNVINLSLPARDVVRANLMRAMLLAIMQSER